MSLKEQLRHIAMQNGAKYFGVAPASRLKNLPQGHRPDDLLASAKSVIVLGIKIPDAAVRANEKAYRGLRHSIFSYIVFGHNIINDRLDWAALQCIFHLEKSSGGCALGIPAGRPKNEEQQMQLMSNRYAAVCAGLGEMGFSGFVLTPEDGPRVRWVSIITNVELEPDALYGGERICRYPACTACIDACPTKALHTDRLIDVEIDGYRTQYSYRQKARCQCATQGLVKGTPGRLQAEVPEKMESMEDWYQLSKKDSPWQRMESYHGNFCQRCMIVCPVAKRPD